MIFNKIAKKLSHEINQKTNQQNHQILINQGIIWAKLNNMSAPSKFNDAEFKVFSQWGDDGLIQHIINNIELKNNYFVEFGVENYTECNTRFLVEAFNWKGLILDGSAENMQQLRSKEIYWKHSIQAESIFITRENIEEILDRNNVPKELALLHIDIDGNDYWVWEKIEKYKPAIVIVEYNALFGEENQWTIPYSPEFYRTNAHHSNLYFGASLGALNNLAETKGYSLVGCNNNGNNAYFVKNELLNTVISKVSISEGFRDSLFRESRSKDGKLTFLTGTERLKELQGCVVFDIKKDQEITL